MGKFVVLVLLAVVALWLIRRALRPPGDPEARKKDDVQGDLVGCAHCGMHLPRAEARSSGGALYCSDEHARLGPGAR